MTEYTIHEPSAPPAGMMARADATQFVKEGLAWWALVLPVIWLLYHRMWLVFAGFVIAMLALELALHYGGAPEAASTWAWVLFTIVFAMHANDLRRWTLSRRGFAMIGAVSGKGQDECALKYFATWPESGAPATPAAAATTAPGVPAVRRQPEDGDGVIGLFPDGR